MRGRLQGREGFGMLEMLMALTLTSAVAILVWTILRQATVRLRDRSERMGMEQSLRVTAAATRATIELLGSDSTGGIDLASMSSDGVIARVVRGGGVVCGAGPISVTVHDGADWWSALREPVAGRDSLFIGTIAQPARWIAANLAAAPGSGTCPDGSPGLVLPANLLSTDLASIGAGSPLRFFEPIEIRSYSSATVTWLGVRGTTGAGSIQPLAGPFLGTGITFAFLTSTGTVTASPASVGLIAVRAPALTERAGGLGAARLAQPQSDSTTQSVALRNVP